MHKKLVFYGTLMGLNALIFSRFRLYILAQHIGIESNHFYETLPYDFSSSN
jgi:hypothetical protein